MKELSGLASGDAIAHKNKGSDDACEPDSVHPVTMAVVHGARAERPMVEHGKAAKRKCASATFAKSAVFCGEVNAPLVAVVRRVSRV